MKWAKKHQAGRLRIVVAGICAAALALAGWREWDHKQERRELLSVTAERNDRIRALEAEQAALAGKLESRSAELEEARLSLQSLRDRIANLEAQRDHLRTEGERQAERARLARASAEELETRLESARHELLEARSLPQTLQSELAAARGRLAELEEALDALHGAASLFPPWVELGGLSKDGTTFSIRGNLSEGDALPRPVFLCQAGGILLEGWLSRVEDNQWIGHVERWQLPSSTLVKGEKVFILPRQRHEADY